ncbi:MAG: bifunctional phosphopantothenoylcysteine decarboxylase/phosphopantothenate--cysteine ligase CoaBC [Flavobacteriales bacterium]|nr:bifunctional phosphopantothenoylcysteine decarboxylase/phosphopantothenate--cysteine ligase CoaBC [Flavobacteriales bacterium]|tara:strand:- start:7908 stop:9104 length:1197 start_codon:yes stop_codon:yes gene_type:complete
MLKDKKIIIGVTGSIAAYKSAELVRLFKKSGAQVRVIQTESSLDFVSPLTLSTLSGTRVLSSMIDVESGEWNNHVDLAIWADFLVIAPLTANTMAKMVKGECDNLLLAIYLSAKCPVYFAPAMDLDMYKHQSTINNISKLREFGNRLIPSKFGELASGLVGEGRMAEPSEIIDQIISDLSKDLPLSSKRVLITAGPTYEAIDPVRFIGNRSSGKMGVALAIECANHGANVELILGPSSLSVNHSNIKVNRVENTNEMYHLCLEKFDDVDIAFFAAAVSDYKPKHFVSEKIKKQKDSISIEFVKNIDILYEMSLKKKEHQIMVGFALETFNEIENAKEKLKNKNLDLIVLNSLNDNGAGFDYATNKVSIIDKQNNIFKFDLKDKTMVANDIVNKLIEII